jgi:hypothetical protein
VSRVLNSKCPKPKASKDYLNSVSGHETQTRLVEAYKY